MKTAMEIPVYLNTDDYYNKTIKFLEYYTQPEVMKNLGIQSTTDIWLIDNASDFDKLTNLCEKYNVYYKTYEKHYTRTAHLEYPYCWRGLYFCRDLFQEYDYEKVIHLNNDVFLISPEIMNHIKEIQSGWWYPWCAKHSFPECDIQVITKDNDNYWKMTGKPYLVYNGHAMEHIIDGETDFNWQGDRHSEYGITTQQPGWDFSCQVPLTMEIVYNE